MENECQIADYPILPSISAFQKEDPAILQSLSLLETRSDTACIPRATFPRPVIFRNTISESHSEIINLHAMQACHPPLQLLTILQEQPGHLYNLLCLELSEAGLIYCYLGNLSINCEGKKKSIQDNFLVVPMHSHFEGNDWPCFQTSAFFFR